MWTCLIIYLAPLAAAPQKAPDFLTLVAVLQGPLRQSSSDCRMLRSDCVSPVRQEHTDTDYLNFNTP